MQYAKQMRGDSYNPYAHETPGAVPVAYVEDMTAIEFGSDDSDPGHQTQRFVAGSAFFNYEAGGSLREGLAPISLFTKSHFGLAAAALWGGFFFAFTRYHLFPVLAMYLNYTARDQNNALTTLMAIPTGIAIVIGMITDKYPIYGLRRKPYMIIGFVMTGVFDSIAMALYYWGDVNNSFVRGSLVFLGMAITTAGLMGMMPTYALTIEYAQREHLHRRGELQLNIWVMTFLSQAIAGALVPYSIKHNPMSGDAMPSTFDFGQVSLGCAFGAFATAVLVIFFLDEDLAPSLAKSSLQYGFLEFWAMIKQFVFAGILIGLCGMQFFTFGVQQNIESARMFWSGVQPSALSNVLSVQLASEFFAVVVFRLFMINMNWRTLGVVGTVICFVAQLAGVVPVCYEVLQSKVWYYVWMGIASVPQGWITVLVQLIATEVTKPGQEGAIVGLLLSIYFLFTLGSLSVWDKLSGLVVAKMTPIEIFIGSHETRMHIMRRVMIFAAVHLVGFATVLVLPTQKLDAQQRLAFGGASNSIRTFVVLSYFATLLYDIIANVYALSV